MLALCGHGAPAVALLAAVAMLLPAQAGAQLPWTYPGDAHCLLWYGNGCHKIEDKDLCLSSRDGRPWREFKGKPLAGQPCVWCNGGSCKPGGKALCMPWGWTWDNSSQSLGNFSYATCDGPAGTNLSVTSFKSPVVERNLTFTPMATPGQLGGQACRGGGGINDGGQTIKAGTATYFWIWTADSLEQCQAFCAMKLMCSGIEYHAEHRYCEVWWKKIKWTQGPVDGSQCFSVTSESAAQEDLSCLQYTPKGFGGGCSAITEEEVCTSSRDGRLLPARHGVRIHGEPCVWCGGRLCTTSPTSGYCEPQDYLMHGEGKAFPKLRARVNLTAAHCRNGTQVVGSKAFTPVQVPDEDEELLLPEGVSFGNTTDVGAGAEAGASAQGGGSSTLSFATILLVGLAVCAVGFLMTVLCRKPKKKAKGEKKTRSTSLEKRQRLGSTDQAEKGSREEMAPLVEEAKVDSTPTLGPQGPQVGMLHAMPGFLPQVANLLPMPQLLPGSGPPRYRALTESAEPLMAAPLQPMQSVQFVQPVMQPMLQPVGMEPVMQPMVQSVGMAPLVYQTYPGPGIAPGGGSGGSVVAPQGGSVFDMMDLNHDGVISRSEFQQSAEQVLATGSLP